MGDFFYANVTGNDNKGGVNKMLAINVIVQSPYSFTRLPAMSLSVRVTASWRSKRAVARLQQCVPRFPFDFAQDRDTLEP
jgi:hypothetical protein